jgi:chromosome segregation ATPase
MEHARESPQIRGLNASLQGYEHLSQLFRDKAGKLEALVDEAAQREQEYRRAIEEGRDTINELLERIARGEADGRLRDVPEEVAESVHGVKGSSRARRPSRSAGGD